MNILKFKIVFSNIISHIKQSTGEIYIIWNLSVDERQRRPQPRHKNKLLDTLEDGAGTALVLPTQCAIKNIHEQKTKKKKSVDFENAKNIINECEKPKILCRNKFRT